MTYRLLSRKIEERTDSGVNAYGLSVVTVDADISSLRFPMEFFSYSIVPFEKESEGVEYLDTPIVIDVRNGRRIIQA